MVAQVLLPVMISLHLLVGCAERGGGMGNVCFHIAVVEDNPGDLHMIQAAVPAGLDCTFTVFSEGTAAIEHIAHPTSPVPDLAIIDLNVPGIEGPRVLNAVRSNTRRARPRYLSFTSSHSPVDMARVKLLGFDRYLIKPMDLDGFLDFGRQVKEWLEGAHGRTAQGKS